MSELNAEKGGTPIDPTAERGTPRVVYDMDHLARRMGVADVSELTEKQLRWGLVAFGPDVGTVVWEKAEQAERS